MNTADLIVAHYHRAKLPNITEIADKVGVSRQRAAQVLKARGLKTDFRAERQPVRRPKKERTRPFLEKTETGQIVELLGLSTNDAAEWLGVHPVTMSKYINGGQTSHGDPLVPTEPTQLLLLATLGLGHEGIRAAINEGRRRLRAAVDSAKNLD